GFDVDLVKLPITPALRFFVTKHRTDGEYPVRTIVEQIVLNGGADYAGSELGTQGEVFIVQRVGERVHFFLDDVGDFSDTSREQAGILEHRRTHVAIAVSGQPVAHNGFKLFPLAAGVGQDVFHAREGTNFLKRGHGVESV